MKIHKYFIGLDPGQVNQGIALINEDNKIMFLDDTGQEMPDECHGAEVPDCVKNAYQTTILRNVINRYGAENIGMILMEGPNYSHTGNVSQISIGSIHGINWQLMFDFKIDFAVLTPKSIQYAIHGTAKDITKKMTMDEMKKRFDMSNYLKRLSSNKTDALAMAYLAKKVYELLNGGTTLTEAEKEIFTSTQKYKGHPKGLIFNLNSKLFLFDSEGKLRTPTVDRLAVTQWRAEHGKHNYADSGEE